MKNAISSLIFVTLLAVGCGTDKKSKTEASKEDVSKKTTETKSEIKPSSDILKFNKDSFDFSITGYGGKDKSYIVSEIVFKDFEVNSPENKLLGTKLTFDPKSIDTSKNMDNGLGGEWPIAFAEVRNQNIINGFVNNMAVKEAVTAEITNINDTAIELNININGVSKVVELSYSVNPEGLLLANGEIDVLDFNTNDAFEKLGQLCTLAFHQGKTWSEVKLEFSVRIN